MGYLSVFLVNLVLAILLAAGICLAGYTLVDMITSENTGIDGIGTALILVFAVWTVALTVFLITMLPQLQMLTVAVLRMMKKTPLFREVFWHEYAKIPRHTSQNSIAAGNLSC